MTPHYSVDRSVDGAVTNPSTDLAGHVLSGRYVLQQRLGAGGAGVVWRAEDRVLERAVAVKMPDVGVSGDKAASSRFRFEATAAARLSHPNAVTVFDIGSDDGQDYLVMELVEGCSLASILRNGTLAPDVVATLGTQLGQALAAAHERGLVHRDVKPSNILVTPLGVAKLADFGIARALGEATTRVTQPGGLMGTARYVSPEQLRDGDVDGRADVYSLGLVLFEALTGSSPFGDGSAVEVAMRRLSVDVPPPSQVISDVPAAIDSAISRATRREPSDRFSSADDLVSALAAHSSDTAVAALALRINDEAVRSTQRSNARQLLTSTQSLDRDQSAMEDSAGPLGQAADAVTAAVTAVQEPGRAPVPGVPGPTQRLPAEQTEVGATAPDVGAAEGGRTKATRATRKWLIATMVAAAAGIVAMALLPVLTGDQRPADTSSSRIEVVDGGDHDPFGSGEEHSAHVASAFDRDPTTYWRTAQYRGDPEMGGLKPGVGLWLDLGAPVEVAQVVVSTTNPGASFTLYAADDRPDRADDPRDWGIPVANVEGSGAVEHVQLAQPVEAQVWLIWITRLPPDGDRFRATVSDVQFVGA